MKHKLVAIVLSILLLVSLSVPVVAEEPLTGEDAELVSELQSVMGQSSGMSSVEFYSALNAVDNDLFTKLSWDVPTAVESEALLNLEYASLVLDFNEMGFGTKTELEIPKFNAGYTGSITDKFVNTFGDLSDRSIPELSLPKGWTLSSIMADAQAQRNAAAMENVDSSIYKSVVGSISIGNCFAEAKKTMSMPELESQSSLSFKLASMTTEQKAEWEIKKGIDWETVRDAAAAAQKDPKTGVSGAIQDIFQESIAESKANANSNSKTVWQLQDEGLQGNSSVEMIKVLRGIRKMGEDGYIHKSTGSSRGF